MTNLDNRILERFEKLRLLGRQMLLSKSAPTPGHITSSFVDIGIANQWFTSCLSLIAAVFSRESEYYRRIYYLFISYPKYPQAEQAFGAFLSAFDEYKSGGILSVRKIVEAELFDEFLEQAEHLFSKGYHAPAAVIAGCVLEDALRKLCISNYINLTTTSALDWMNSQLAKAGLYNKLTQKRITALADIRNSAAHGKWTEFAASDVEDMLKSVRAFMADNFG